MANNRLFIEDTKTGERFLLAKSFGGGWGLRHSEDELQDWLLKHDDPASWGTAIEPSTLRLIAENDEP